MEDKVRSNRKNNDDDDEMDIEDGSDSFDKEMGDSENTEEENTETEDNSSTDEEITEDDSEEDDDGDLHLEDDEDTTSRRTVSTAARRRSKGVDELMEEETDASSIIISLGDDVDTSPRVESLLCRQTFPMSRWLSIFSRMNTRYVTNGSRLTPNRGQDISGDKLQENIQLYLVKWRNLSYLHCSWESESSLMDLEGTRMKQKIRNFLKNEANLMFELTAYGADVYFNPDFVEIDRVLDVRIVPKTPGMPFEVENNQDIMALLPSNEYGQQGDFVKEFRVKWKGLQYSEISWEIFEDFQDTEVIDQYYEHLNRDISAQFHIPSWRPPISEYRKIHVDTEYKGGNKMRSYQVEGANWMIWNWRSGRNSILADEMGLGKTVQSTMFMNTLLKEYGMKYPFLVVAPLSTIPHWEAEIRRWTDMHVVVLHGNVQSRENILKYEWKSKLGEFDVLITTYEIAIMEAALLSSICWTGVVVDEAHRLKGKNNKLGDVLRKIEFGCKLLLTGTPLQNNTEELWTLLNFLQPEKFDNSEQFQNDFGDMKESSQLEKLHELLKPYMLRRMKEDVEKSLKPKEETVINVELTAMQKKFYRAVYDHNTNVFIGQDGKSLPSLMNVMMELRKCCNHPFLIRGAEPSIIAEVKEKKPDLKNDDLTMETLLASSGKMVLLDKLLPKLQSQGHRVLLFSQMVRMLDIIQDYLSIRGYAYERIDGSVKVSDRQAAIERFSTPGSDRFIFLICTRAGGFGINLTAADTVIIYDSDWNPQNDIQAQARCHRIGQDKAVKVYRLITNRTYEMEMFQRANLKLGLDKAVLNPLKQSIRADGGSDMVKMSKKDAETLLKYGAYDFFKEEREGKSEELSNAFCEADIDQILEKNTKVITIDSQGGSSFSKASFITDTSAEVDINDPNFWTKIVGLKPNQEFLGTRSHRSLNYEEVPDTEKEGYAMDDEAEWNKSDRDTLLKLLLSFGWNNWEPIFKNEKMKKHNPGSVQMMAISIIVQIARGQKMLEDNDKENIKNGGLGSSVKIFQEAREAFEFLHDRYEICSVLMETTKRADAGDTEVVKLPRVLPGLLRDVIWWRKEIKTMDRHLKQLSFMCQLHQCCKLFNVKLDGTCALPTPRRAALPAPWWTMREDYDVLLGVIRNGWGNWKEICSDPDLCFFKEGVIYKPSKEEKQEEKQEENKEETEETPAETTPSSPVPTDASAKIFPPAVAVMKRIRRLVSTMDTMGKNNQDDINMDLSSMVSPKKSRQSKGNVPMIDDWSQIELKNLRSSILRWGLPLPPMQFSLKHTPMKSREEREILTIESIPSKEEALKMEECLAGAAACLSGIIQQLVMKEGDVSVKMEVEEEDTVIQDDVCSRWWLGCYPVNTFDSNREFGLYSNKLGPFEFLRIQSKLKTKGIDAVQAMCRRMERRVIERFQQAKEVHAENEDKEKEKEKKEKEKDKEDLTDVIPSNVIAQRLYRRIQFYYDIHQFIFDKDSDMINAIISKWIKDGPRRQDRLSDGWDPLIHDVALLKGIRKWGFLEWDMIWSYPEMPFIKPIPEKKKDAVENPNEVAAFEQANEALLSTKTVDRSIIVPGLTAAHAIRRLQSLLEMFRDYDTYEDEFKFNQDEPSKDHVMVCTKPRRVVVSLGEEKRLLPQSIPVSHTIFWKMNRMIPVSFSMTSRSEVFRGDPSRAQISAGAMQYYERWLDMEKEVSAGGYNIKKLPSDLRLRIRERATELVQNISLPMRVRSVTVLSFGMIPVNWNTYQSDKYIWPIGYKSIKSYFSYVEPSTHVEYINEILDGGVKGPIFSVTAKDDPDHPFTAGTPTGCWSTILARVRKERARMGLGKTGTAVSGPEFFGFAMPEIAACIEGLPGSEFCRSYICRCLRMERSGNGKSRLKFRKQKISSSTTTQEEPHEHLAPRRAAQMASKRWQKVDDSESSADFSEEDESVEEIDSDSDHYYRKSRKRAVPSQSQPTEAAPAEHEEKAIKTEQLI